MTTRHSAFALVTGASSGIGAALALRLAESHDHVALVGRNAERLAQVADGCRARGAECRIGRLDITDREEFARFVAELEAERPIRLFVSNAGILEGRTADATVETAEVAHRVLDTNLTAAIDAVHVVLPTMRARRSGDVVLVSSLAAFAPLPDAPAYSAAKAGLNAYGAALDEALSGEGIRVLVTCPGYVATAMGKRHLGPRPGEWSPERAAEHILDQLRRGRRLSGFPVPLYWSCRLSVVAPSLLRRMAMRGLRFHVGGGGS